MTQMRKNPFTGKMEPYTPRVMNKIDLIDPKPLPEEAKQSEYNICLKELADIRAKYAALNSGQRAGVTGDKLMKAYRHESLKLMHVAGEKAPPIYNDI